VSRGRPNPRMVAELRRQPAHRRALAEAAGVARQRAETFARAAGGPWMPRKGSGSNQTIVIDTDGDTIRVINTDHAGHLLEWGSVNNPAHAPLRRGVLAAGFRLDET
jgi:hypothetical protein